MTGQESLPRRSCPACGSTEVIGPGEAVWPPGWRCPLCDHVIEQQSNIPMLAPELADTLTGFDPALFAAVVDIEASHFWFVARNELIVGLADRFFPQARRFLEIGCGNGGVLRAMSASRKWDRVVGTDLHPTGLSSARSRLPHGVEFAQMNALAIPAVAAFDLIGAFDIVEHVADDERVLRAIHRALCPGGSTIIAVPQHPWLWSHADDVAHHERRYRRGELEAKLRRNGFEIISSLSFTAVLLPLLLASRLKARFSSNEQDLDRERTINPTINAALLAILRAEVRLSLAGLRWPMGGSRVVLARAI